ncbi:hypothetical protein ABT354_18460 [Streptomyces sp. NPDC000594]|uniref:hypothetical protein n=1 Tax=Streptomyces sp. NPDC000594 TaxID=3154261 RepID=UPI00331EDC7B
MRRGRTAAAVGAVAARVTTLRRGLAVGVSCALLQTPMTAEAVMGGRLTGYQTDPQARAVIGSPSPRAAVAPRLVPGTYTDTIAPGDQKFYHVELDATSNAYLSAVLAPPPGRKVGAADGIRVSLVAPDGTACGDRKDIVFGGSTSLPIADYLTRRIGPGRACQAEGRYLYSVEWIGPTSGSAAEWPIELKYMVEPGLKGGSAVPDAPVSTHSHTPGHVGGDAEPVRGGSGFNDAATIGQGVSSDGIGRGESRFYRVPLDWGQQLFVDAEFGGKEPPGRAVYDGVRITVFNTARGHVQDADGDHRTRTTQVSLATEPVAFANRSSDDDETRGMRFAGWYYIRVSADRAIPDDLPLILRVDIEGEPQGAPEYDGDPFPAGFGVLDKDRERAASAAAGEGAALDDDDDTRKALLTVVGVAGIGLGTALVLGLLGWTALARLGLGRKRGRHASL